MPWELLAAFAAVCWAAAIFGLAVLARGAFDGWLRYLEGSRGASVETLHADVARLQRDVAELVESKRIESRSKLSKLGA